MNAKAETEMKTRDLSRLAGARFERKATLDFRRVDPEARTVPAALSSETPVSRWYGNEILVHDAGSVNLTRAADGLPLLWNHDSGQPIGLVENVRLDAGKLRGDLRFSSNPKANEIFQDVRDGFLKNVSIGYLVDRWEETADSEDIRVTGWTLLEASVVTVPADETVGINRSFPGENPMAEESKPDGNVGEIPAGPVIELAKITRAHSIAKQAGAAEAIQAERKRITDLDSVFSLGAVRGLAADLVASLRAQAIDGGWSPDQARTTLLEALSGESVPLVDYAAVQDRPAATRAVPQAPANAPRPLATPRVAEDALDKFFRGAEEGILVRACIITDKETVRSAREGGMYGKRLSTLAGDFLRLQGVDTARMSDDQIATRAIATRSGAHGQTTADFTYLLANVANKSLLMGFDEAPETWATWTRRGQLPDFKTADRINMSGFTGLSEVAEDGEITYGKFTDRKETIKLVQYAKKYRMSRQLLINDDLGGLTQVPRLMGRAANRKIGDVVYALLDSTGPTLTQDSTALWNTATHKNYVAAATAPTVATLNTAITAMAKQTDPNTSAVLNIRPRYLVVPVALEATARVLMSAVYDPAGTAGTLPPNPFSGRFEVVTDARLDGQTNGTAAWYLFADPNLFDTFEVAFLNGVAEPYLRENQPWDGQGVEYVTGIDFGVSALDFRAVHKYRGS